MTPATVDNPIAATVEPIRYDVPEEVYFASPEISHSGLKAFVEGKDISLPRARGLAGNYTDTLLLEPDKVAQRFIELTEDGPSLTTKDGKAWMQRQRDANFGLECIRPKEYEPLKFIVNNAREDKGIAKLLENGRAQVSVFTELTVPIDDTHEFTVDARARLDWVTDNNMICDVKTQWCANREDFATQAVKFGYYSQAAWYLDLWKAATGEPAKGFVNIVLSKRNGNPFLFYQDEDLIAMGRKWYRDILKIRERCKDAT